jgi:hypothetical protein
MTEREIRRRASSLIGATIEAEDLLGRLSMWTFGSGRYERTRDWNRELGLNTWYLMEIGAPTVVNTNDDDLRP